MNSTDSAVEFKLVTPNDSTTYNQQEIRQIMVTTTVGDLVLVDHKNNETTLPSPPLWTPLNVSPKIIKATGTTAAGIFVLMSPRISS